MPTTDQETFVTWLKDAHALEEKLIPELKAHAAQAGDHPQVQAKIEEHLQETERHAEIVKGLIEQLGSSVSSVKTAVGKVTAFASGAATAMADDKIIKNALAEFTMEHTEIASYVSLIAAAEHLQLPEVVQALRGILREEELMADWLRHEIGGLTITYLREQTAGAMA